MEKCTNCLRKLLRKKSMKESLSMETPLDRCLKIPHLVFFSMADMFGSGIYILAGVLIRDKAGPAAFLSYILAGLGAITTGVCYTEFASYIPKTGSGYLYTYIMLGEFPAFIIGWTMLSDWIISSATNAKGFSATIDFLVGGKIGNWSLIHVGALNENSFISPTPDLLAAALIILMVIITLTGANISMSLNVLITSIQVACLLTIIIACYIYGDIKNWTDYGGFFPFGITGVIEGSGIAVFAYSGFELLATTSEEVENPRRSIPIAMFTSLGITTIFYVLATLGISYLVPRFLIDYGSAFVSAFSHHHLEALKWIAAVGTLIAVGLTKLTKFYVMPRLFYAMAKDGLIFSCFSYVESRQKVPIGGVFVSGVIAILMALFFKIESLAEFFSIGLLFSYYIVGVNLLILRYLTDYSDISTGTDRIGESTSEDVLENDLNLRKLPKPLEKYAAIFRRRQVFIYVLWSYVVSTFMFAAVLDHLLIFNMAWSWILFSLSLCLVVFTLVLLSMYRPTSHAIDAFETPLMPLAPAASILINAIMLVKLSVSTWIRFSIWTLIGVVIYLIYGIHHSTATLDETSGKDDMLLKNQVHEYGSVDSQEEKGGDTTFEKDAKLQD